MMITVRGSCGVVHSSFEEWQNCKACRAAELKNEQMSRAVEQLTGDRYEFKGAMKREARVLIHVERKADDDALRRARKMWSGPFPELFTRDGEVRGIHRLMPRFVRFYRYMRRLGGSRWEAWTWALANLWARRSR
jgi:hypothetical protein